jgi:hypothetical protein
VAQSFPAVVKTPARRNPLHGPVRKGGGLKDYATGLDTIKRIKYSNATMLQKPYGDPIL